MMAVHCGCFFDLYSSAACQVGVAELRLVLSVAHNMKKHGGCPLPTDTPESRRKMQLDALLLALPGVSARKINGLHAYFAADKMFACISGNGVGLRLPSATVTELQFSRDNVVPFQPAGMASTREWVQIDRADAAAYTLDLPLFQASLAFVTGGRTS